MRNLLILLVLIVSIASCDIKTSSERGKYKTYHLVDKGTVLTVNDSTGRILTARRLSDTLRFVEILIIRPDSEMEKHDWTLAGSPHVVSDEMYSYDSTYTRISVRSYLKENVVLVKSSNVSN